MPAPKRIADAALSRISAAQDQIQFSLKQVRSGRPLSAEPDEDRKVNRIAAVAKVSLAAAARIANYDDPKTLGLSPESIAKAEAIQGKTADYVGVAWLDAGRIASRSVGRILFPDGDANGSGFLVSDRLILTNNHVIPDRTSARGMTIEFRYEIALGQSAPSPVRFRLDPDAFFETDDTDDLDFTLIAIGQPITAGASLVEFGRCPLSSNGSKHMVGDLVNIVQHPDGDFKQVVVRENRIVNRGETVLHYIADTEPGSSGSPVFNDLWHVVALHHWGGPHREVPAGRDMNEGIRVSAIIKELETRSPRLTASQQTMLRSALAALPPSDFGTRVVIVDSAPGPHAIITPPPPPPHTPPSDSQPPEAGGSGAPASRIDRRYSNRRGYNERFLPGLPLPMPQLTREQRAVAARVRAIGESAHPFELKYNHFSVVLNAERRMPFYSICNIDGSKRIRVNRDSGLATSQPEATEHWAIDPRVPEEAQLSDAFYTRLRRDLRTSDFFARGHMTRREDPVWGTAEIAQHANNDTYHHTNACPQVQNAFNGSQKVWQGIENFILNSADDSNLRVTVLTGPVFTDEDPEYIDDEFGSVRIPRRFWKIVARVEDGVPMVFAVLADQSEVMDLLFAARRESREAAFDWPRKLSTEYQSTVAEIAELTGFDFGDLVLHDVFATPAGESRSRTRRIVTSPESLVPRRPVSGGFGNFASIGDFLDRWERGPDQPTRPESREEDFVEEEGAERRRRPRPQPRPQPQGARKVVEINGTVTRLFADDLSGAKHQQFTVTPDSIITADPRAHADVQSTIDQSREVRLAVRFGDSRGIPDRIPGIVTGVELHLKGEWISAQDAFSVGGERIAVLHFTHEPLGFVCTPVKCFS